jgi:hypothetical protein
MKIKTEKIVLIFLTMVFSPPVLADSLDSPAAPSHADSAMYTFEDIYNRLNDGAMGAKRSGPFVEPNSGPTDGTGHTLNEIMDKAPVINANGAIPAEVLVGKYFWGLVSGNNWGLKQGTAPVGANVFGTNGNLVITIPDGFYSGNKTATASDSDLTAANIKSGVNIFGFAGSVIEATGNANAADVLTGLTFSKAGNAGQTGTMPNNGTVTITPSITAQTIAAGYHNGSGTVLGDTDLTAANIKSGVNIFGVAGTHTDIGGNIQDTSSGDATAADIASGKKAWVDGTEVTGNVSAGNDVSGTNGQKTFTIPDGLYSGNKTATANDTDLTAANIKSGVDIFGVAGSVVEATGNATAANVLTGLTFSNSSGAGTSGTMADKEGDNVSTAQTATAGVNKLTAPTGFYDGDDTVTATDAQIAALDSDLTAANIKKDVVIFGVTGTYEAAAVEKTGQTKCYNANSEQTCPVTGFPGQDGEHQKGVAWPIPRFTALNGTVTDNLTGLIWLQNANCAGAKRNWTTALNDVVQLNTNGKMNSQTCGDTSNGSSHQTDWRLPNIKELQSLIDFAYALPALSNAAGTAHWIEGNAFSGVQMENYWSSSTDTGLATYAWYMFLHNGSVNSIYKTNTYYVWPVRGGQ